MSQNEDKAARLASALRANLARRKAQARARRADAPEKSAPADLQPPEGPAAPSGENTGPAAEGARAGCNRTASGEVAIVPGEKAR